MVIPQTYAPYLPKTHMEMILAFMYVQECIMWTAIEYVYDCMNSYECECVYDGIGVWSVWLYECIDVRICMCKCRIE